MNKPDFIDGDSGYVTLSQDHSLILPHIPAKASLSEVQSRIEASLTKESISSFGLFGDVPNYSTFYPGISEEDWVPKEGDFIEPLFRFFSETIVVKYGIPIDFSTPGLVKNSMMKLLGATVYPDHESMNVGNALGAISRVEWQDETMVDGIRIPAGINGTPKVDAKSNPRIARAILMNPPAIHSTSVTVRFKWEKSHPDMEDFWEKAGSFDENGELIRLIVSEVTSYSELSFVPHGADPYAQRIGDNGTIINPQYAKTVYAFSADGESPCRLNFKGLCSISNSKDKKQFNNQNNKKMDLTELLKTLGFKEDKFSSIDELKAHFSSLEEENTSLKSFKEAFGDYTPEKLKELENNQLPEGAELLKDEDKSLLAELKEVFGDSVPKFKELKARAEVGDSYLTELRADAKKFYKLIAKEEEDQAILTSIEKADLTQAKAFVKLYKNLAEKETPLTCQECGSTNVSRASFSGNNNSGEDTSYNSLKEKANKVKGRRPHDLHG